MPNIDNINGYAIVHFTAFVSPNHTKHDLNAVEIAYSNALYATKK